MKKPIFYGYIMRICRSCRREKKCNDFTDSRGRRRLFCDFCVLIKLKEGKL